MTRDGFLCLLLFNEFKWERPVYGCGTWPFFIFPLQLAKSNILLVLLTWY